MKALTYLFWTGVGGIAVSFAMSIYTGVQIKKERDLQKANPEMIAVPATATNP